jgi:hypothetical protein
MYLLGADEDVGTKGIVLKNCLGVIDLICLPLQKPNELSLQKRSQHNLEQDDCVLASWH